MLFLLLVSCSNQSNHLNVKELKEDLNYLNEKLNEIHPDIEKIEYVSKKVDEYRSSLTEEVSENYFKVKIMEILAILGDSHTGVLIDEKTTKLPIQLLNLDSEIIVISSSSQVAKKGDKVLQISGKNINVVINELRKYISYDNEAWFQHQINFLTLDFLLESLGLLEQNKIILTVERDGEIIEYEIDFDKIEKDKEGPPYNWEIKMQNSIKIGYFKLVDSIYNQHYESTIDQFFDSVDKNNIESILIDLRFNSGGDSRVINSFLKHLNVDSYRLYNDSSVRQHNGDYSKDIYILTDSGTFSSGAMFATIMKDNGLGKIIGGPVGQNPTHFGDPLLIELPNSNIKIAISQTKFIRPATKDEKNTLLIDMPISKTAEELLNEEDRQLERALDSIVNQN